MKKKKSYGLYTYGKQISKGKIRKIGKKWQKWPKMAKNLHLHSLIPP